MRALVTAAVLALSGCKVVTIPHAERAEGPPAHPVPRVEGPALESPSMPPPTLAAPSVEKPRDGYVRVFDAWPVEGPSDFDGLLSRAAHRHLPYRECFGIPAEVLLKMQMMQESSGDPLATSGTGPAGLMQLARGTARDLGISDRFDPAQNIDGGARYLRWTYRQWSAYDRTCEQRYPLAVTAYADGLRTLLDLQPETGARYWPEFEPYLSEQGQHYFPAIMARLGERAPTPEIMRRVTRGDVF